MADFYPVAADVKPQDPNQAFGAMNNILGLQQKRQALQIQGQQLQQEQIKTDQLQGSNQFFSQVPPDELHDEQGNISAEMAHKRPEYKALSGVARVAVDTQLNQLQNQQLTNKQALTTMNADLVTGAGKAFFAASQEKDPERAKAIVQAFAGQSPEAARLVGLYGPVLSKVPPEHLSNALGTVAKQTLDVSSPGAAAAAASTQDVAGQREQANPVVTPIARGGTTDIYNVNRATGIQPGQKPVQSVTNTLAPSEQLPYVTQRAASTTAATTYAGGGGDIDVRRAAEVSGAQKSAAGLLPLTQEIDRLTDEISSSKIAGGVTAGLKHLGFADIASARAQLNKDLGLVQGPLVEASGSDTRANEILKGYPTDETPAKTTHAAMDYIRGAMRQNIARGELLKKNGIPGFAAADDELTRSTGPLEHEAASLAPGKANGFYPRNFGTPEEATAFKQRLNALKKHTKYLGDGGE